jgi:hypothetical protein
MIDDGKLTKRVNSDKQIHSQTTVAQAQKIKNKSRAVVSLWLRAHNLF